MPLITSSNQYFDLHTTCNLFNPPPSLMYKCCNPVNTRRLKNVFKTSFERYECLKDVSETSCVHWGCLKLFNVYLYMLVYFCKHKKILTHTYLYNNNWIGGQYGKILTVDDV